MNYIKQIKHFYDQLEENPVSTSAIALWHALMHANNKTGWRNEFSVAASLLMFRSGLSERMVFKARNELKQKGYITFRSRKGNQSAVYSMIDLSAQHADSSSVPSSDSSSVPSSDNRSALLNETKLNETKDDEGETRERENPFTVYQDNFGVLRPLIAESISDWCDFFSDEIVIAAMKLGIKNNAHSFNYVESILRDWFQNNLKTIEDVRAYERSKKKTVTFPDRKESRSFDDIVKSWEQKKEAGHYD